LNSILMQYNLQWPLAVSGLFWLKKTEKVSDSLVIDSEFMQVVAGEDVVTIYLYNCTVHFVVYLSNTPTNAHTYSF